eukprot:scaffold249_cov132-Isochrysis_galbana.AAC.8
MARYEKRKPCMAHSCTIEPQIGIVPSPVQRTVRLDRRVVLATITLILNYNIINYKLLEKKTTPRARGGVTMAPRQLRLEPTEVVSATDKGAMRVRVDSTDENSPQV